jgi:hypothetical protein
VYATVLRHIQQKIAELEAALPALLVEAYPDGDTTAWDYTDHARWRAHGARRDTQLKLSEYQHLAPELEPRRTLALRLPHHAEVRALLATPAPRCS